MGNTISKVKLYTSKKVKKQKPSTKLSNEEYEVIVENERNVKENMRYHLSNHSEDDIDRQHSNHFLRSLIYKNNYSAPIGERLIQGCKVLDVGCGPGTWLLDLANIFQDSRFYGVDIKPIYPKQIKPNNIQFGEANILDKLPFSNNEFDFTHQEVMALSIGASQWDHVISELIRVTKPGGYIEIVEYTSTKNNGPILDEVYKKHKDLCLLRGVDVNLIPSLDRIMKSHEYIKKVFKDERMVIVGPNGGKIGMVIQNIMTTFSTSDLALEEISCIQGISKEVLLNIIKDLQNELKETKPELSICRFWAKVEKK